MQRLGPRHSVPLSGVDTVARAALPLAAMLLFARARAPYGGDGPTVKRVDSPGA